MATKPAQICQLEKDKLIDTQQGFVDTFNWAVQAIANLKGGENCEVTWPTDDTPTIDCNSSESEGGGGGGGGSDISAVYDVIQDTNEQNQDGLTIQYIDGREDKFIPLSGGGAVTFRGTDSTVTSAATSFNFQANTNSNVVVTASGTTLKIGVYYI